jgi:hypothetical protein
MLAVARQGGKRAMHAREVDGELVVSRMEF